MEKQKNELIEIQKQLDALFDEFCSVTEKLKIYLAYCDSVFKK